MLVSFSYHTESQLNNYYLRITNAYAFKQAKFRLTKNGKNNK